MGPLNLLPWWAKLLILAAIVSAIVGAVAAYNHHQRDIGREEVRAEWKAKDLADAALREADAVQQRKFNDQAAGKHAATVASLNDQLGAANEKISRLPGRACLDPRTASVLNATGVLHSGTATGKPASAPETPSATASNGTGLRVSTDRDVAGYIALIRTKYAELADQLNQILDIEDKRHPPVKP